MKSDSSSRERELRSRELTFYGIIEADIHVQGMHEIGPITTF